MPEQLDPKPRFAAEDVSADWGFRALLGLVLLVAGWLIAMPWVASIQQATMHRFHLRTPSFALWAMQQPIPAMYNLANRYEVYASEPAHWTASSSGPEDAALVESRYINHFPTRLVTFANTRYRLFASGEPRWLQIQSAYRGERLTSRFVVRPQPDGGMTWERLLEAETIP